MLHDLSPLRGRHLPWATKKVLFTLFLTGVAHLGVRKLLASSHPKICALWPICAPRSVVRRQFSMFKLKFAVINVEVLSTHSGSRCSLATVHVFCLFDEDLLYSWYFASRGLELRRGIVLKRDSSFLTRCPSGTPVAGLLSTWTYVQTCT